MRKIKPITREGEKAKAARRLCNAMLDDTLRRLDWPNWDNPEIEARLTAEAVGKGLCVPIPPGKEVEGLCV